MTGAQAAALLERIEPGDRVVMSPRPLERVRHAEQIASWAAWEKPTGLWYGCGDEWLRWTMSEMPDWLADYKHVYTLRLNTAAMLVIRTDRDFKEFTRAHITESGAIDWPRVAKTFTGIEICPARRNRRMRDDERWYSSWDVASGCIWDPAAVREITRVAL